MWQKEVAEGRRVGTAMNVAATLCSKPLGKVGQVGFVWVDTRVWLFQIPFDSLQTSSDPALVLLIPRLRVVPWRKRDRADTVLIPKDCILPRVSKAPKQPPDISRFTYLPLFLSIRTARKSICVFLGGNVPNSRPAIWFHQEKSRSGSNVETRTRPKISGSRFRWSPLMDVTMSDSNGPFHQFKKWTLLVYPTRVFDRTIFGQKTHAYPVERAKNIKWKEGDIFFRSKITRWRFLFWSRGHATVLNS